MHIYHIFFMISSAHAYSVNSISWLWNSVAINMVVRTSFDTLISVPLDTFTEVGLLGQVVIHFNFLKRNFILFLKIYMLIYISIKSLQGFPFLHILTKM
jgi:hypothetical protein